MNKIIPQIIYGTAWKEERTEELVLLALRSGFRAIDTANQRKHYFEAAVGNAITTAIKEKIITRQQLFLQTKFTYQEGQDHRLPYDPQAPYPQQVAQSFQSSLEHLQTTCIDSYLLHGPLYHSQWSEEDTKVWRAMESLQKEGKIKYLGVSNVNLSQLQSLLKIAKIKPTFVQNRCFAATQWDKSIREFCKSKDMVYQGFSLLTANRQVLPHLSSIAQTHHLTPQQVIFTFAQQKGMIPLTGTNDPLHMHQDLAALQKELSAKEINNIENSAHHI